MRLDTQYRPPDPRRPPNPPHDSHSPKINKFNIRFACLKLLCFPFWGGLSATGPCKHASSDPSHNLTLSGPGPSSGDRRRSVRVRLVCVTCFCAQMRNSPALFFGLYACMRLRSAARRSGRRWAIICLGPWLPARTLGRPSSLYRILLYVIWPVLRGWPCSA